MSQLIMFDKVKELIFGLNGMEKTRMDHRYIDAMAMTNTLQLSSMTDFLVVEEIIYKIKELLRVRSSNLNKAINDPTKKIRKRDVLEFLDVLEEKRNDFIKKSSGIDLPRTIDTSNFNEPLKEKVVSNKTTKPKSLEIEKGIETKKDEESEKLSSLEIFANDHFHIVINDGKVPYLKVIFKSGVDLPLLKKLASVAFEVFGAHGTNILIQNEIALIIPRFGGDELFHLPKNETDVEEVYGKLIQKLSKDAKGEDDKKSEQNQDEYVEKDYLRADTPKTKKKDEDSLDILLEKDLEKKPHFGAKINPFKDGETIEFIKDDSKVETIKKDENELKKEKVEKVEDEVQITDLKSEESESDPLIIYKDEKIIAKLSSDSKAEGEIQVKTIGNDKLQDLNESDLAYLTLFSKAFASILFEVKEAHGTNVIWDYNSNMVRIIPRYQDDGLNNLNWSPKNSTDEFLDQVKNKLLDEMKKEVVENGNASSEKEVTGSKEIPENPQKPVKDDKSLEDKAKIILDYLNKIP